MNSRGEEGDGDHGGFLDPMLENLGVLRSDDIQLDLNSPRMVAPSGERKKWRIVSTCEEWGEKSIIAYNGGKQVHKGVSTVQLQT